ncbi:ABC transporter ATP-binding protein [Marinicrinis sediminis]|uniref:ABC transporter ATP-binding protein n=1 Tax=Marinicrinis sediminis TaxID=1652465 RepID=A0ABW5RDI2_9BACL
MDKNERRRDAEARSEHPVRTVVEMRGITKRFGGLIANDRIDLKVTKGEIHALLGENGAGKSTLMNILFGLYQPDEGQILIQEKPVRMEGPNQAIQLGIGMVHQHFKLVQNFTVVENIVLGLEPRKNLQIDYGKARQAVMELSRKYGLEVKPDARIEDISVGMQQRVEILKTLYRGADILILDEPTAVLTPQEIQELMEIMRKLVKDGKSIVLITHKLKEIMAVSDQVTVIRRGKVIDSIAVSEASPQLLAEKMVGREVSFTIDKSEAKPTKSRLTVEQVYATDTSGKAVLKGIDLEVKGGEILGIAGVDGNGQKELIEVLAGLRKLQSGRITIDGQEADRMHAKKMAELGLSHIPEDRHKHGLVLDFTMTENMALRTYDQPRFQKYGLLHYGAMKAYAATLMQEFDVRPPETENQARSLSGGNQQKAIIAREIDRDPAVLIAAQPTRGLDVGAIEFIHRRLIAERDKGKAVLLISFEMDEILHLSDRIVVMYEGEIVGHVNPQETNDQELGLMMAGSKRLAREEG